MVLPTSVNDRMFVEDRVSNPVEQLEKITVDEKPVEILTVKQAANC